MNQTLVGVFNSQDAAERAAAELAREGFDRSAMQIKAAGADAASGSTTASTRDIDSTDDGTGVMASIRHFFRELFGDEEEHAGNYTEAVRRGSAVLTVEADEDRIDAAREALTRAGAIDIDEQVSSWRSEGWTGDDSGAAATSARGWSDEDRTAATSGREQTGDDRSAATSAREQAGGERENVVPVVQEELEVGKRQVNGGAVRVVSRVVSQPVSESVELRREEATIERHPVDRPATEADLAAFQERTIEVQEMAEKAVVNKTAHVVEEVVVGKHVSSETQRVEDTVRRTEVEVERVGDDQRAGASGQVDRNVGATAVTPSSTVGGETSGDMARSGSTGSAGMSGGTAVGSSGGAASSGSSMAGTPVGGGEGSAGMTAGGGVAGATGGTATNRRDFADFDDEFRRDYQANYASSGGSYEDYQPAYRGGYESRSDSRYADRDWDDAEPELRQRWESEHPGSAWERVKAAVRRGWDKATS